jgi:anti-sigma factor RsiW
MSEHDCRDDAMRDLLPLLAHDALEPSEAAAVRAHLAVCGACVAELALIESASRAISASVPQVSTAAILAGVQQRTRLKLERPAAAPPSVRTAARWMPRRYAMAAASLILVASASLAVVARTFGGPEVTLADSLSVAAGDSAPATRVAAAGGISVSGGLADLSDDDLSALLADLEEVEATVAAEPVSMRRAIVDDPENF